MIPIYYICTELNTFEHKPINLERESETLQNVSYLKIISILLLRRSCISREILTVQYVYYC